jgi:hypothetical protein
MTSTTQWNALFERARLANRTRHGMCCGRSDQRSSPTLPTRTPRRDAVKLEPLSSITASGLPARARRRSNLGSWRSTTERVRSATEPADYSPAPCDVTHYRRCAGQPNTRTPTPRQTQSRRLPRRVPRRLGIQQRRLRPLPGQPDRVATDPFVCRPIAAAVILAGMGFPVILELRKVTAG